MLNSPSDLKKIHFDNIKSNSDFNINSLDLFESLLNTDKSSETHILALRFVLHYIQNIEEFFDKSFENDITYQEFHKNIKLILGQKEFSLPENLRVKSNVFFSSDKNFTRYLYKSCSLILKTSGCWLRNISSASTSHLDYVCSLHHYYYQFIGGDDYGFNFFQKTRGILSKYSLDINSVFRDIKSYGPESHGLLITNIYMSIGLYPRFFTPEIIGITLFEAHNPYLGFEKQDEVNKNKFVSCLYEVEKLLENNVLRSNSIKALNQYLEKYSGEMRDKIESRICNGYILAFYLRNNFINDVIAEINSGKMNPHNEMLLLIRKKAKYAESYHSKVLVNGNLLNELLAKDAELVLHHLAKSVFVRPGDPDNSRLCNKSLDFGGPMFRIFNEQEVKVIRRWVASLSDETEQKKVSLYEKKHINQSLITLESMNEVVAIQNIEEKESIRSLYYHLLNIEYFPNYLNKANQFVRFWLYRCGFRLSSGECSIPFKNYNQEKLDNWFNQLARDQVLSYENQGSSKITRNALVNASVQLCPMIFIDGAWLQKIGEPFFSENSIGTILNQIYSDEVGNGKVEWNHPNLYRELMKEMSIDIPEFGSKEFANFKGFNDKSFLVPVFWLSISLFPKRYFPELLGLNLAMELSGVGGAYRIARDQLKSHGFSTLFVDLHNTIDNVSTGHSFMALEAIKIYLEDLKVREGLSSVDHMWKRIWIGYRALVPPKGFVNLMYANAAERFFRVSNSKHSKNKDNQIWNFTYE
ncbi:hypothetical protein MWMV2_MWMV2_03665 [Acinetobacter oleivorans]|uniref:iron-containing redox enzyme family protein n=1 Tax=Acinetobacter oleivorans TaxID=1148157 RepID=UPI001782C2FC|nr:iron-containing redox enzyme family protein [Acinetobacter oleivorans]CAI3119688.1 hypothetical protein MWMV5_MWMV5_03666 [Acinetobacter oleivorans]CAI3119703.1 hypothetical protein MWMV13_MWMV13_03667 [Acinetobacter oleivorans]CAI3119795.1 hypothetical protein MWMV2_MWMV2_03665 [Acinetobacter oleivorans]CAI3119959.1 hypothetical protein MWMV12_MWMV12_03681 [Acinetobacter oleivorans]CAI3119969.1 hypothetical protein MWMV3_MWMV3_03719 [Acinetobacter oleivorans]